MMKMTLGSVNKRSWINKRIGDSKGLTLVEMMVSLALMGIVLGLANGVFMNQWRTWDKGTNISLLQMDLQNSANVISTRVRCATEPLTVASGKLTVKSLDSVEKTYVFAIEPRSSGENTLKMKVNGGPGLDLLPTGVSLEAGSGFSLASDGKSAVVVLQGKGHNETMNLQVTVKPRKWM